MTDVAALRATFDDLLGGFVRSWGGRTTTPEAVAAEVIALDRAYFVWKAAADGRLGADYEAPADLDVQFAVTHDKDERPVIFFSPARDTVQSLELVKRDGAWRDEIAPARLIVREMTL